MTIATSRALLWSSGFPAGPGEAGEPQAGLCNQPFPVSQMHCMSNAIFCALSKVKEHPFIEAGRPCPFSRECECVVCLVARHLFALETEHFMLHEVCRGSQRQSGRALGSHGGPASATECLPSQSWSCCAVFCLWCLHAWGRLWSPGASLGGPGMFCHAGFVVESQRTLGSAVFTVVALSVCMWEGFHLTTLLGHLPF